MSEKIDYEIDVMTELDKKTGNFNCPKCGDLISPEAQGGEQYVIIDTKFSEKNSEYSLNIVLRCKCGSVIKLTKFPSDFIKDLLIYRVIKIAENIALKKEGV